MSVAIMSGMVSPLRYIDPNCIRDVNESPRGECSPQTTTYQETKKRHYHDGNVVFQCFLRELHGLNDPSSNSSLKRFNWTHFSSGDNFYKNLLPIRCETTPQTCGPIRCGTTPQAYEPIRC